MATGVSVQLPLSRSPEDGYTLNKTIEQTVKQNLKMLILTSKGERVCDGKFGVSLRDYLFRQNDTATKTELSANIQQQVRKYMSFLEILNITFPETSDNVLAISVSYRIKPLNIADILSVAVST